MKTRKLLLTALSMMFVATSAFALASCDQVSGVLGSIDQLKGETGDKGETGATGLPGEDGAAGKTITNVEYDENGDLVFTFSDGSKQTVTDPNPNAHKHTYGDWTKFSGEDCTNGIFTKTCDCGHLVWAKDIGHAWTEPTVTEATCYAVGYSTKECTRCGEDSVEELHVEHTVAADDKTYTCSTCNYTTRGTFGLTYELLEDDTYAVTGYTGTSTEVTIPGVYNNRLVTEIKTNAFYGTSYAEPSAIKEVTIPTSVKKIGVAAFGYTSLKSVTIPDSVEVIEKKAFQGCPKLRTVTIGKGVTSLDETAFCANAITSFTVSEENTVCKVVNGDLVSFDGTTLIQGAFGGKTEYTVPAGITTIAVSCFQAAPASLEKITIGNDVTTLPAKFAQSAGIKSVVIEAAAIIAVPDNAFYKCASLESATLHSGITTIGASAFRGTALKTMNLENVTTIAKQAFQTTTALKSVVLGAGLTSLKNNVFVEGALEVAFYPGTAEQFAAIAIGGTGNDNFKAAIHYFSETQPTTEGKFWHYVDGVPTVWPAVEGGQTPDVDEPTTDANGFEYELDGNSYMVKAYKGTATVVVVPAEFNGKPVTKIWGQDKGGAFTKTAVTNVTISEGITEIGGYAFSGCAALTTVTLPSTLTKIEYNAFASTGLTALVVPEGVKTIGYRAFYNCNALTSITLPNTLTALGAGLFKNITDMTKVTINFTGTQAQWTALINNVITDKAGTLATGGNDENNTSFAAATISYKQD